MLQVPRVFAASPLLAPPLASFPAQPQISSIQGARAVAVLMVLLMHAATNTWLLTRNPVWETLYHLGQVIGNAGVDLFFVISGAIMYLVTRAPRDRGNVAEAVDFLSRRALRIYPLYWLTLPLALMLSENTFPVSWREIFLYIAPIQHGVTWTLAFELRFYLVVGVLLLVARRHMDAAFIVWSGVQILVCLAAAAGLITPPFLFENSLMIEFVMGLGVGALVSRRMVFAPGLVAGAGCAGLLAGAVFAYFAFPTAMSMRALIYGLPMALLLYAVVTWENVGKLRVPGVLRRIGDMSYSIYLWHLLVASWLFVRLPLGHGKFMFGLRYALKVVILSLMVSAVSYWLIEKPSLTWGRRAIRWLGALRAPARNGRPETEYMWRVLEKPRWPRRPARGPTADLLFEHTRRRASPAISRAGEKSSTGLT